MPTETRLTLQKGCTHLRMRRKKGCEPQIEWPDADAGKVECGHGHNPNCSMKRCRWQNMSFARLSGRSISPCSSKAQTGAYRSSRFASTLGSPTTFSVARSSRKRKRVKARITAGAIPRPKTKARPLACASHDPCPPQSNADRVYRPSPNKLPNNSSAFHR